MSAIFALILLFSNLISHWYVFFDHRILLTGDWTYFFSKQLLEFSNYYLYAAFMNFGTIWAFPGNSVFYHFYYFLHLWGVSYDQATRVIFLLPILILTPFFSFQCFWKLTNNQRVAFFATSLYIFNTFFLRLQTDFLTWAFVWWILPALIFSVVQYFETNKSRYLLFNSFLVFLAIAFEIRLAILIIVFSALFVAEEIIRLKLIRTRQAKTMLLPFLSLGVGSLFHLYWVLPLVFTNVSSSILSYASAVPFVSFYNIKDVLSIHLYYWSKNLILEPFIRQPFEWQNYLTIFLVLVGIISPVAKRILGPHRLTFLLVCFTGVIFLGKQELLPFPEVYGWLFRHIPLFSLYRESSKFLVLAAFIVSLFFGIGLSVVYDTVKKRSYWLALGLTTFLLFLVSFYNLQHFFDQRVGGMTKGIEIPDDYLKLEQILANDDSYYRLLWLPTRPDFGFNSNSHPAVNAVDLTTIYKNKVNFVLFDGSEPIQKQLTYLLNQPYSAEMLNAASIRYVVVPNLEPREVRLSAIKSETVYKYFEFYGPRESFVSFLDKTSYLRKVNLPGVNLDVYENASYLPHLSSDGGQKVDFVTVSPTEYRVNLGPKVKKLYFSESYNKNWLLVKNDCDWWKVLTQKNQCVIPAPHAWGNYNFNEFDTSNVVQSEWVKLYFYPQIYVHLGFYVSVVLLTTYLVFLGSLKRNEKNNH